MEGTRKNRAPSPGLSFGPGASLNVGASKNLLSSRNVSNLPSSQSRRHQVDGGKVGEMWARSEKLPQLWLKLLGLNPGAFHHLSN